MRKIKKIIGGCIWDLSEYTGLGLGRFAPIVFGWMLGSKGQKQ